VRAIINEYTDKVTGLERIKLILNHTTD